MHNSEKKTCEENVVPIKQESESCSSVKTNYPSIIIQMLFSDYVKCHKYFSTSIMEKLSPDHYETTIKATFTRNTIRKHCFRFCSRFLAVYTKTV